MCMYTPSQWAFHKNLRGPLMMTDWLAGWTDWVDKPQPREHTVHIKCGKNQRVDSVRVQCTITLQQTVDL